MLDHLYIELGAGAAVDLLSHWAFFIRGEHDLYGSTSRRMSWSSLRKCRLQDLTVKHASWETAAIETAYVVALFSSMITYRMLFHPLRHIPGPLRLRWTKLTQTWDMARFRNCDLLHELRGQYGDVVRFGKLGDV
jgi:hypothetical protein